MNLLEVKNLTAQIDGKAVLQDFSLQIAPGQVHAIMGPNGSGKSSFSKILAGHPKYEVTGGTVAFEVGLKLRNLLEMAPEVRAAEGLFLAYQYPTEIPGIDNFDFLLASFNAVCKHHGTSEMNPEEFRKFLHPKMAKLGILESFLSRGVNSGFSGGEKKRNEILQLAVLSPRLAILDETDSGLDIDALKTVAEGVNSLRTKDRSFVLITHYQRLLNYIKPDFVHVLVGGKIVESGDFKLAEKLEAKGYDWLIR